MVRVILHLDNGSTCHVTAHGTIKKVKEQWLHRMFKLTDRHNPSACNRIELLEEEPDRPKRMIQPLAPTKLRRHKQTVTQVPVKHGLPPRRPRRAPIADALRKIDPTEELMTLEAFIANCRWGLLDDTMGIAHRANKARVSQVVLICKSYSLIQPDNTLRYVAWRPYK